MSQNRINEFDDEYTNSTFGFTEEITDENFYIPTEADYIDFGEEEVDWDVAANRPGLWENIRRKKEREGKNYKPAKTEKEGRPTQEQLKKAQSEGAKSDPRKTPAPKKDQKKGSKKNKPDSAKDDKGKITFSKSTTDKLKQAVTDHNKKGKGPKASLGMLKAVYRRGAGAYSTSHAPKMSRDGWAMARVRAFLYLLKNGRPSNTNYKQDNDLLPSGHKRSSKAEMSSKQKKALDKNKDGKVTKEDFELLRKDKKSDKTEAKLPKKKMYIYKNPRTSERKAFDRRGNYKDGEVQLVYVNTVYASEYQGRKVKLGKPFRTPDGPKKMSVYVKNEKGNVVKVNFGDPNMEIKKDNPARRKSFRARHKCDNPGPRWKARYWSCKAW